MSERADSSAGGVVLLRRADEMLHRLPTNFRIRQELIRLIRDLAAEVRRLRSTPPADAGRELLREASEALRALLMNLAGQIEQARALRPGEVVAGRELAHREYSALLAKLDAFKPGNDAQNGGACRHGTFVGVRCEKCHAGNDAAVVLPQGEKK